MDVAPSVCLPSHRRWRGEGQGGLTLLKKKIGGPPRFGLENFGNAAENWFGKKIPVSDLFTNCFSAIAFGEVFFSRFF